MAHTKGPWTIRERTVGHPGRRVEIEINAPVDGGRMEHPICRIPSGFTNQDEDARLIAASPRLLEALQLAYRKLHMDDPDVGSVEVGDVMCNALCEAMGDRGFQAWARDVAKARGEGSP